MGTGQQLRKDLVKACSSEPTSAGTHMHYSHKGLVRIKSQVVSSESFYCHILLLHPPFLFSEVTWQLSELFVSRNYHHPLSGLSAEQPPLRANPSVTHTPATQVAQPWPRRFLLHTCDPNPTYPSACKDTQTPRLAQLPAKDGCFLFL